MSLLLCGSLESRGRMWSESEMSKVEEPQTVTRSRMWPGEWAVERK